MILSVGAFQSGDYETCADEIEEMKAVCGEHPLKVILETGELKAASEIKKGLYPLHVRRSGLHQDLNR